MLDLKQIIKYGVVGTSGVLVNIWFLYMLTEYIGIYYILSGLVASEISIMSNFVLNDTFTFNTDNVKHTKLKRFLIYNSISAIGTGFLIAFMYILTEYFSFYYIHANLIGMIIVFAINYMLNKHITWRNTNE